MTTFIDTFYIQSTVLSFRVHRNNCPSRSLKFTKQNKYKNDKISCHKQMSEKQSAVGIMNKTVVSFHKRRFSRIV